MVAGQREAHELLLIEEADAWFEYLEATRAQSALRYKEVEPWAAPCDQDPSRKAEAGSRSRLALDAKLRFPSDWTLPLRG